MFRRVWVVRNPVAGWKSGGLVDEMLDNLIRLRISPHVCMTGYPGHARQLVVEACQNGADLIIVAGGDGTLSEVVNGLADFRKSQQAELPAIAVFPAGTINLVAQELGVPSNPARFADLVLRQTKKIIWPGKVNGHYFIAVIGAGFDAYVVEKVSLRAKRFFSRLVYAFRALTLFMADWPRRYKVEIDGRVYAAVSVIVINSRYYAGRYSIIPEARLTDRQIHVCIFERGSRWDICTYILYLLLNKLYSHQYVKVLSGERVVITGPEQAVQVDGDIAAALPLDISAGDMPVEVIA